MRGAGSGAGGWLALRYVGGSLLCLCLSGCLRVGYDVLGEAIQGSETADDLAAAGVPASFSWDAGSSAPPHAPAERYLTGTLLWQASVARPLYPRDASPPSPWNGADAGGGGAGNLPLPAQPCALSGNEQVVSGFDAPTAGLEARGPGTPTLSWTDVEGSPSAGALEFSNTAAGGGEVYYSGALGDLRSRPMSLNVRVAQGSSTRVRLFVESGPQRRRARAPFRSPPPAEWDCMQLHPGNPASAEAGFDPADIVGAGLEMEASEAVRVYVDQIAY